MLIGTVVSVATSVTAHLLMNTQVWACFILKRRIQMLLILWGLRQEWKSLLLLCLLLWWYDLVVLNSINMNPLCLWMLLRSILALIVFTILLFLFLCIFRRKFFNEVVWKTWNTLMYRILVCGTLWNKVIFCEIFWT